MKLYKTTSFTPDPGELDPPTKKVIWTSSAGDASKARTAYKTEAKTQDFRPEVDTIEVEVPTTRAALIEFLNGL